MKKGATVLVDAFKLNLTGKEFSFDGIFLIKILFAVSYLNINWDTLRAKWTICLVISIHLKINEGDEFWDIHVL